MDDDGRSQKADKPRKAKKSVRSGFGDQGDERCASPISERSRSPLRRRCFCRPDADG